MRLFVLLTIVLAGCAETHYYADPEGKVKLPGMPFLWKDSDGKIRNGFVKTCSGFGTASFEICQSETTGIYSKFTNNLDSTAAAQLAGGLLDKVFEFGRMAGAAEMNARMKEDSERLKARIKEEVKDETLRSKLLETPK